MSDEVFVRRTRIEAPVGEVFAWHARPGALERLTPPWETVEVVERTGGIKDGARVVLRIRQGPLTLRWVAEHRDYVDGRQFRDVQIVGPFASWEHTHRFEADGPSACRLEDRIEYALPLGNVGRVLGGACVREKLDLLFDYRHRTTRDDIAAHRVYGKNRPMHLLITGASGLVGSALVSFLTTGGHWVSRLVRSKPKAGTSDIQWNPSSRRGNIVALEGCDAVVHLAGENIAAGRWTAEKKARIRDSRVQGTRVLCESLARLTKPPEVLVCASATGYYGDRGEQIVAEDSAVGSGFLAEVCREWEAAAEPAVQKGIRVVHLRFGMVLSPAGGALAKMLPPFRLGAGGQLGSGRQYWGWIAVDDAIGAIYHALATENIRGPVNAVAPSPVTNYEFTKVLGRVLARPTPVPVPAFAARLAFGEMADATLLSSARAEPIRLLATGYQFRFPVLEGALRHLLGRPNSHSKKGVMSGKLEHDIR